MVSQNDTMKLKLSSERRKTLQHFMNELMSKNDDFLGLLESKGSPPQLIWVTCGNTSNSRMREVLSKALEQVKELIDKGETVVEIRDKP